MDYIIYTIQCILRHEIYFILYLYIALCIYIHIKLYIYITSHILHYIYIYVTFLKFTLYMFHYIYYIFTNFLYVHYIFTYTIFQMIIVDDFPAVLRAHRQTILKLNDVGQCLCSQHGRWCLPNDICVAYHRPQKSHMLVDYSDYTDQTLQIIRILQIIQIKLQ